MTTIPQSDEQVLFSSLPPAKPRWGVFGFSFVAQAVGLSLVATITFSAPKIIEKKYQHIELAQLPEQESPLKPHPVPSPKLTARLRTPEPLSIAQPKLRVPPEIVPPQVKQLQSMPKIDATPVPKPQLTAQPTKMFDHVADNRPASPKAVQINTFGSGSSAEPTLRNKTVARVQTGGFGSPNGFAPNPNSNATRANVAATGSFDLPAGPGHGNGSGGAKGSSGVVASAGFGNGGAIDGGRGGHASNVGNGRVQTTSFGDGASQPASATPHQLAAAKPATTPVSIQSKPLPAYTAEARQLRVEGEVLLEVTFTANGQVRIVRVVRGLGHGLDESAMRAAQAIRFIPAQRDGRPVDSTATLHIVFQLS